VLCFNIRWSRPHDNNRFDEMRGDRLPHSRNIIELVMKFSREPPIAAGPPNGVGPPTPPLFMYDDDDDDELCWGA
jgi:hypothetical protein